MMPVEWEKSVKRELVEESNARGGGFKLTTDRIFTYIPEYYIGRRRKEIKIFSLS
jgi:hypothetical protein